LQIIMPIIGCEPLPLLSFTFLDLTLFQVQ
jgi:hypothetical protein